MALNLKTKKKDFIVKSSVGISHELKYEPFPASGKAATAPDVAGWIRLHRHCLLPGL